MSRRTAPPPVTPRLGSHGELLPVKGFSRWLYEWGGVAHRGSAWRSHDQLYVLSTLEISYLPGTDKVPGPQWHISVSRAPNRSTPADVARVVAGFAMPAFDEDNHHPGIARHLWCPVDPAYRTACECKITETLIVDGDYAWTNDETEQCRGCHLQGLTGAPCPLHAPAEVTP